MWDLTFLMQLYLQGYVSALIRIGLALVSPFCVGREGGKLHAAPGRVGVMGNWGGSMREEEFAVLRGQK